jgi:sugar (pentulose or hexulose) kinase
MRSPGEMPDKIAKYCRATSLEPPRTHGEYARTILESLALRYREVMESLEELGNRKIEIIHILGGGSRNAVLNRFTADCTGCKVVAGPVEATAIGNILVQAIAAGDLSGLDEAREFVRVSFPVNIVEARPSAEWERAYERFRNSKERICAGTINSSR